MKRSKQVPIGEIQGQGTGENNGSEFLSSCPVKYWLNCYSSCFHCIKMDSDAYKRSATV